MGTQACWLTAIGLVLLKAAHVAPRPLVLDLTTPTVARYERSLAGHCIAGGIAPTSSEGNIKPPTLPIRVEAVNLDRKSYAVGEAVRATVRLTNIGRQPIPIPWALDVALVLTQNCTWQPLSSGAKPLHASVAISLVDDNGNSEAIVAHYLYGVTSDPATYRTLAPKESVVVRMPGRIDVSYINEQRLKEKKKLLVLPLNFKVVASFEYSDVPRFGEYPEVQSENTILVRVTDK